MIALRRAGMRATAFFTSTRSSSPNWSRVELEVLVDEAVTAPPNANSH